MLDWIAMLALAAAACALFARVRGAQRVFRGAAIAVAACVLALLIFGARDLVVQKIAGYLLMPSGLLFLGLGAFVIVLFAKKENELGAGALALFLGYTIAANVCVATWLTDQLESDFPVVHIADTPELDAVLVLGGGATLPPDGQAKISDYGDRVVYAARLYFAHKTKILVTSGSAIPGIQLPQDLSEATRQIWTELQIPDEAILRLPEPKNTKQEIAAFKALVAERGFQKIGVLSSAWHLRRARALAEKEGLQAIFIAADHRGGEVFFSPALVIPQPGALKTTQNAIWELVGRAVGR